MKPRLNTAGIKLNSGINIHNRASSYSTEQTVHSTRSAQQKAFFQTQNHFDNENTQPNISNLSHRGTGESTFYTKQPLNLMSNNLESPSVRNYIGDMGPGSYQSTLRKQSDPGIIYYDLTANNISPAVLLLEELLTSSNEWINIQSIVRTTFKHFYDLFNHQQLQIARINEQLQTRITHQEMNDLLLTKCDIEDLSKSITELHILVGDQKQDADEFKKQINNKIFTKQDFLTQFKSHQSMIDELRKSDYENKTSIQDLVQEQDELRNKQDDMKKDQNKKLTQIYRDLEKLQIQMERKVQIDDFNERLDNKADKQMLVNALLTKISKNDLDQALLMKADQQDFKNIIQVIEGRMESELQNIHDILNRKSNIDDIQYYRKELQFKLDKNELEAFRQEYVERVATFEFKIQDKSKEILQIKEGVEKQMELMISQMKQKIQNKIEQKVDISEINTIKQEFKNQIDPLNSLIGQLKNENNIKVESLNDRINRILSDIQNDQARQLNEQEIINQEFNKIKEQIKFLIRERSEDINSISEMLRQSQKKIQNDVSKLQRDTDYKINENIQHLQQIIQTIKEELTLKLDTDLSDKVRVDEVQDALRRLTESYQSKIETVYTDLQRNIESRNDNNYSALERIKIELNEFQIQLKQKVSQDKIDQILNQLEFISKDLLSKSDKKNTQAQLDFYNESLASLNKDMLMKANIQDIMLMLDKKVNSDEIQLDINYLKNTLQKYISDLKQTRKEQDLVNETLCSENCVARWIWKQGQIENGINCVKWDSLSVNTCPDNFLWSKGAPTSIRIDAAGLYEVTMAFFSKQKKPLIQILANNEVVVQSVSKTVCNACGTASQVQANGHIQKMCNGMYKVSLIEFIALPSKAEINVVFSYLNKDGSRSSASPLVNAEGFIGLRKL